jgi:hypothetical protein
MNNKMGSIRFLQNIADMLDNWESCAEENVGWCLLCDGPIRSAQDLIQNSNAHTCPEIFRLEPRLR